MRPVSFGPLPPAATADQKLDWNIRSLREMENASAEDTIAVADSDSQPWLCFLLLPVPVTRASVSGLDQRD
jgi:hypothetical protein